MEELEFKLEVKGDISDSGNIRQMDKNLIYTQTNKEASPTEGISKFKQKYQYYLGNFEVQIVKMRQILDTIEYQAKDIGM